jgi:hypothetical protein
VPNPCITIRPAAFAVRIANCVSEDGCLNVLLLRITSHGEWYP